MFERMLDKTQEPTFAEMTAYCKTGGAVWRELDDWLKTELQAAAQVRFPYGNKYGWSVKYSRGKSHICDIFAEDGAFTVFLKLRNADYAPLEAELSACSKEVWSEKYPCGDGGWLSYRVTEKAALADLKSLIAAKAKRK